MVGAPCRHEGVELMELLAADGCLDFERLQIVAKVAVNVFVIVAMRKLPQLPAEALVAGVVLARGAPAIAAPVSKRLGNPFQPAAARKNGPTFTHGQMVRRIKALRRKIPKRAGFSPPVGRTKRI